MTQQYFDLWAFTEHEDGSGATETTGKRTDVFIRLTLRNDQLKLCT